jgi:cell surface protein SprA
MRWDLSKSLNIDFTATNNARVDEPDGMLDTKLKKDTVKNNFWNGGRNTLYNQKATLAYTLPLSKFPLTDWINARYSYTTTYNWIGASRIALTLGNTLENSQENEKIYLKNKKKIKISNNSYEEKRIINKNVQKAFGFG